MREPLLIPSLMSSIVLISSTMYADVTIKDEIGFLARPHVVWHDENTIAISMIPGKGPTARLHHSPVCPDTFFLLWDKFYYPRLTILCWETQAEIETIRPPFSVSLYPDHSPLQRIKLEESESYLPGIVSLTHRPQIRIGDVLTEMFFHTCSQTIINNNRFTRLIYDLSENPPAMDFRTNEVEVEALMSRRILMRGIPGATDLYLAAYMSSYSDVSWLVVIDGDGDIIHEFPEVHHSPTVFVEGMEPEFYAIEHSTGNLVRINPVTGVVVATFELPEPLDFTISRLGPTHLSGIVSPDGGQTLFYSVTSEPEFFQTRVVRVDTVTGQTEFITTIPAFRPVIQAVNDDFVTITKTIFPEGFVQQFAFHLPTGQMTPLKAGGLYTFDWTTEDAMIRSTPGRMRGAERHVLGVHWLTITRLPDFDYSNAAVEALFDAAE